MFKKRYKSWNSGTSKTKLCFICENCGTSGEKYAFGRENIRFCSNKCAHEKMLNPTKGKFGKDHPCWKDEKVNSFRESLRHSFEYKEWRRLVFERDEYTCQDCGIRGGVLEAHHIISYANILKEEQINSYEKAIECKILWDINNGITYCLKCHAKNDIYRSHTMGGIKMKNENIINKKGVECPR